MEKKKNLKKRKLIKNIKMIEKKSLLYFGLGVSTSFLLQSMFFLFKNKNVENEKEPIKKMKRYEKKKTNYLKNEFCPLNPNIEFSDENFV
jgi:hypothetical protein